MNSEGAEQKNPVPTTSGPISSNHRSIKAATVPHVPDNKKQRNTEPDTDSDDERGGEMLLVRPILTAICLAGSREACDAVTGEDRGGCGGGGDEEMLGVGGGGGGCGDDKRDGEDGGEDGDEVVEVFSLHEEGSWELALALSLSLLSLREGMVVHGEEMVG